MPPLSSYLAPNQPKPKYKIYKERKHALPIHLQRNATIHVGKLTPAVTAYDLTDYFSKYGGVVRATILTYYGFVTFQNRESRDQALADWKHVVNGCQFLAHKAKNVEHNRLPADHRASLGLKHPLDRNSEDQFEFPDRVVSRKRPPSGFKHTSASYGFHQYAYLSDAPEKEENSEVSRKRRINEGDWNKDKIDLNNDGYVSLKAPYPPTRKYPKWEF